ncbi:MAG: putative transporter [Prevotella bivia]|jgi:AspT/YidE/YbjL antiporter-like protein|uniref:Putative permease n=1 Tax=Prevotella bivia DSM 20514 TaxID=868129 RepID=I4Z820_9BACT|nr:putative transporter [Prevotella bivia]EFB92539.1 TrkA C-terminal domain protein [Prevotella bivia JCVIHMP010]EIM32362.1 putative permease [Prevotella bivia DSM 20514]MDU6554028.1 putative transporter [Prevotella bivia]MDZ3817117.1 putative transporter [Prevotella bivia]
MDWINGLFSFHTALQCVIIISLICSVGLALGKIRVAGISLGVAFVFFVGIAVGNFGFSVDAQMLSFCETFGLVLFVYTLGLHVGPNFFGSLRHEGMGLNMWSLAVILVGTLLSIALTYTFHIPMSDMVGILSGATTNTPALGAAQQALQHVGVSGARAALATAVTYPLGVVGVIFAMIVIKKVFAKAEDMKSKSGENDNHTFVGQFVVANPAIVGKTIGAIAQGSHQKFIISRIWRGEEVVNPMPNTVLQKDDNILVVTGNHEEEAMEIMFGKMVQRDLNKGAVDWNHLDTKMESRIIVLSRSVLNGKHLGSLHLRDIYGVTVSRVLRGDIKLLATGDLVLRYGDRLTIVGKPEAIDQAEKFLGNSVKTLNEPNVASILFGMLLGLALGTIPLSFSGMDAPIRLGIAGGPIIMGILIGAFGPRFRMVTYTTRSASLMLRKLGLSLYLACLGLEAGKDFLSTVVRPEGLLWIGLGFVITMLPLIIVGAIALRTKKFDFGTICGILCGSMANPMALVYANDTVKDESSNISYATVYPLGMFIRVIIAQILVMFFV